jgi:homoserine kinase
MGPGFDCIGMALQIYNYVTVSTGTDNGSQLVIKTARGRQNPLPWYNAPVTGVPIDESNLIYKTLTFFYDSVGKPVPPLTITQQDYIPMARGLGTSAACVVAGLLAGNALTGGAVTFDRLVEMAARLDGHPDNTTPALIGGLTVGVLTDGGLVYHRIGGEWETGLRFALFVPSFTLLTRKARAVLPSQYTRRDLVFNASRTALLVSAMQSGDFEKLGVAMDDRAHQPYRQDMIPGMAEIMREAGNYGAINIFLSGAGPAMIAVTTDGQFMDRVKSFTAQLTHKWDVGWVKPDLTGASVSF